jgi:hypothetical protein
MTYPGLLIDTHNIQTNNTPWNTEREGLPKYLNLRNFL